MTFTATVQNDNIKLPPGGHLPDGTKVTVVPSEQMPTEGVSRKTLAESLAKFIGCVTDAPSDLAENHDHYLYGALKRER